MRGGGDGCHLRVVPHGQLHRRPSTPKRFCLSAVFIEPGFIYFLCREVSFSCVFCVCFPVVQRFSPRLLCLFSNNFQFKFFIYSLDIHIYGAFEGTSPKNIFQPKVFNWSAPNHLVCTKKAFGAHQIIWLEPNNHLERTKSFGLRQIIIWREPNHLACTK